MNRSLVAFVGGILFGIGLVLGGMTNPAKVINFLDFTRNWDPSLAFVMGGAIAIYAPINRLVSRKEHPLLDDRFHLPTRKDIDARLVIGAVLFGVGWGLGGFCPGPALVSLMSFGKSALVFGASMFAGMTLFTLWQRKR